MSCPWKVHFTHHLIPGTISRVHPWESSCDSTQLRVLYKLLRFGREEGRSSDLAAHQDKPAHKFPCLLNLPVGSGCLSPWSLLALHVWRLVENQQVASQPGDQANGSWKEIRGGKPGHPGSASCSECACLTNHTKGPLWQRRGTDDWSLLWTVQLASVAQARSGWSSSYRVGEERKPEKDIQASTASFGAADRAWG